MDTNLTTLIADEKHIIENSSLEYATKVGQVYCYLSSGPIPMIKIGKGKNGRQRMASWVKEYPPAWRNGDVVFIIDKMNQSIGETSLHKFFKEQRVSSDNMRRHLNIEDWQRLPDGASEWFYCDTFVKNTFRSAGIDLVSLYRNKTNREPVRESSGFGKGLYTFLYHTNRFIRGIMGCTTLLITSIMAVTLWGSWLFLALTVFLGLYVSALLLPILDT